ncbi:cobalt-precorrin-5B (C(1))-methyltransferase CbiD [Mediterraneibacter sp. ICN-202921]|uniref:cobalt-precorrin-5B (C(1))-methyltransferase CbiD n=1 Tax=Mediterraneibacter sp. ICN-202921 TaxID=3134657 RepID=UPI0030C1766A
MTLEIGQTKEGLRFGYTTGSCAAAAAKAGAYMLLLGEEIRQVKLMTPKGICLYLDVEHIERYEQAAACAVRKYSGDDPDITNGIFVHAHVQKTEKPGIFLEGGEGVGTVTRKGLEQEVGEAAINRVPRQMILGAAEEICREAGYSGGLKIVISIPEGRKLAARTFNPRLGIEGGLSILGTSGIVEPMSEKALTDTIYLEMKVLRENGSRMCYLVPGNYGSDFLREALGYDGKLSVKCSNYIGEALDDAVNLRMESVLLIGHVGKLVKLAAGVMNTHSRQADCRMEVLASHAAMAGAEQKSIREIMHCITTTEAIELLKQEGLLHTVMKSVMERIAFYLRQRCQGRIQTEAILFSREEGILGETKGAAGLFEKIKGEDI